MATAINIGDVRRLSVAITTAGGVPTDPTTLQLRVKKPGVALLTYDYPADVVIVRSGVGEYHADFTLDVEGGWRYDWIGTGAAAFAEGRSFYVRGLRT